MFLLESLDEVLRTIPAVPFNLPYDDEGNGDGESSESGEGEGDGEGGGEGDEGSKTPPAQNKKKPPASKVQLDKATQEYVNSLLAEERRKGQAKNTELIKQLETQKNKAGTSEAEKDRLQSRIDELTSEYQTKEQLTQQTTSKKLKALETERDTAKKEAERWQKLFQSDRITNSLLQAASSAKAYNPQQVVTLLMGNTRLVEATDAEGNVIPDSWTEKVKINSKDKDGKPIVLDLSATEAVKQLAEMPEYGNLFISGATGGIGGGNLGGHGGGANSDTPPKDTAAYMAWRADRKKKGLPV